MKVKCEYCSSMIDDNQSVCPNCGAANPNLRRTVNGTPKTIEELKLWYKQRNLPPEDVTRFFIGKDYKGARAFGIYRDGDKVIVYKNKADGTRAIRYEGTDEAYGVNEIYLKLKSEILNQKSRNVGNNRKGTAGGFAKSAILGASISFFGYILVFILLAGAVFFKGFASPMSKAIMASIVLGIVAALVTYILSYHTNVMQNIRKKIKAGWLIFVAMAVIFSFLISIPLKSYMVPKYFMYDNHTYVRYENDWYSYDNDVDDYSRVYYEDSLPVEIITNPSDYEYFMGAGADWDNSITAFEDSDYYEDYLQSSGSGSGSGSDYSNSDNDYDWDSGSDWDSGGSDWDSDW